MTREEAIRDLTFALNTVERDLPLLDKYSPNGMHSRAWRDALKMAIEALCNQQKRGRWVYEPNPMDWNLGDWVCSECGTKNNNIVDIEDINPLMASGANYCPSCGAKMEN